MFQPNVGQSLNGYSNGNPATGVSMVVTGLDDSKGWQVYFYFGTKVEDLNVETNDTGLSDPVPPTAYNFGDVSPMTGAELEAASRDVSGAYLVILFHQPRMALAFQRSC